MYLGIYNSRSGHFEGLRNLTPEEMEQHTKFTPIIIEARERLSVFRMLSRNYNDWKSYLNQLLSTTFPESADISEELNRLLLNYLTFAYTVQEHFKVSYYKRYKKDKIAYKKYEDFIEKLCTACWPFAFLLDYRGYVQHVELGIGHCNRHVSDSSIEIKVTASPKSLLAGSRRWLRSKLTPEMEALDLISILKELHVQMIQSYAVFVAKTFLPELHPAAEFYGRLTKEAHVRDPNARMVFYPKKLVMTPDKYGKADLTLNFTAPPNDVYAELGIKIKRI